VKSDATTTATAQFTYGPAAPQITGASVQSGGNFQLAFTGNAGQPYTIRASSDLSLTLASWSLLATGIFTTNAATFTDSTVTNPPGRFYIISIP
jgi:hypothetical protein